MRLAGLRRFATAAALTLPLAAFTPKNVECVAPANPGGGWDFTCRTVGKLLAETGLVDSQVQVTNMAGGVGAVAYANFAFRRADDPNVLVATSAVGITQIAQGKYPADTDAMRWVGMLGADVGVVLVPKDSNLNTLEDLMAELKANPTGIVPAGSSGIEGWDHLRLLLLAKEAGVPADELKMIKWVEFDGGTDAVTQLIGGHVGVVVTDIGEIGGFIRSGDVRPLAVMSQERLEAYPNIATAKEQGLDVEGYNWRGFYMGGKVGDEAYNGWVDILRKLYQSPEWQHEAKAAGLIAIWRGGGEFATLVQESKKEMAEISKAIGVIQ